MKRYLYLISMLIVILLMISGCNFFPIGEQKGSVSGTVVDQNNNPISGVTISIKNTNYSTTTNSQGIFTYTDLTVGSYTFVAVMEGYEQNEATVIVEANKTKTFQIQLTRIDTNGSISGLVKDVITDSPLSGAVVTINNTDYRVTTGTDGKFAFADIASGDYTLLASMDTYQEARTTITVLPGEDVTANFSLEHLPITITGIVSSSVDGAAIEGAEVSILDQVSTTDSEGEFTVILTNVQSGTYPLTVTRERFHDLTQDIVVDYGMNTVNLSMEPVTTEDLIDEAYNLISNVEDSLYQIGSICVEQGNIAGVVAEEINIYMSQITPYLINATMGLGHLAVFGEYSPGFPGVYEYFYDTQFEYGYYELIEKGDLSADTWEWIIIDEESGLVVTITAPNVYDFIVLDNDEGSVIDLTNCTFTYDIEATYDPDTTYHAEVVMGSGDPLVITDGFDSFILPSGDTASLYAEINPATPLVDGFTLDTDLLLDQLDEGAFSVKYMGKLDTPVLDYEGNLSVDFGMNLDFMPTWADVKGLGVFTTSQFTLSGGFDFAFDSEVWLNEYDEFVFAYRMDHVDFDCSYETVTGSTTFDGYLGYKEYENYKRGNLLLPLVYDVYAGGSLTHNDKFYTVDVNVYDYTTGMDITADIASNEYHLSGSSSIDFDADAATMNFVDDNGVEIELNMYAEPWYEPIGFMAKYDEKLAEIRLVENDIFGIVLEVAFENGEFIWFPWDPRVYLFNGDTPK